MAEIDAEFDLRENRLMNSWVQRNPSGLKSLVSRDCLFLFGATPPALLDRKSFVAAMDRNLICNAFQFHETTARRYGRSVWFSGHVELALIVGGRDWSGHFLVTDLWRKGAIRRRWQLAERSIAPLRGDGTFSSAIRAMQLWR
jgi:hypothetical protein